jgi:hypothetical protein
VSPVTTGVGEGSIYGPMSATDSPPDPPSPLDMSRVIRATSEDIRQPASFAPVLGSFLNPAPPTSSLPFTGPNTCRGNDSLPLLDHTKYDAFVAVDLRFSGPTLAAREPCRISCRASSTSSC